MTTRRYASRGAVAGCGRLPTLWRLPAAATILVALAVAAAGLPVAAQTGGYPDVDEGNVHAPSIDALVSDSRNILADTGCGEGSFCPDDPLPRWVMAVWLVRALDGEDPAPSGVSSYTDVDSARWWSAYTNRLGQLEVTGGCRADPPRYCPDRPVTRGQMATFFARAFDLAAGTPGRFSDTAGNVHTDSIDKLAAAGITAGCAQGRYCPDRPVTRAQMATFLARALKLVPLPQAGSYRLYYEFADYSSYGGEGMWIATLQGVNRKLDSISFGGDGIFSPDGALVAYTKRFGDAERVYVLNLNGGAIHEIAKHPTHGTTAFRVGSLAWSPNGKLLTYVYRTQSGGEVWIGEPDGQNWRKLSNTRWAPRFSPDSRFITYPVMGTDWNNYSHSVIESLSTGSQVRFSAHEYDFWNADFTHDSQSVFYSSNYREVEDTVDSLSIWDYLTIDTDGTNRRMLASGATSDLLWSPDGTRFTYRGYGIYDATISEDDGETWRDVKLTTPGDYRLADASGTVLGEFPRSGSCESVRWQPDSDDIVFNFKQGDKRRYMVANANSLTYRFEEEDSFWFRKQDGLSPDRQRIAYTVESPFSGNQLWVMDADGSNSRKLIDRVTSYEWSPDGQYIAYGIKRCEDPSCNTEAGRELWIAEVDGSRLLKVAGTDGAISYRSLRWISS